MPFLFAALYFILFSCAAASTGGGNLRIVADAAGTASAPPQICGDLKVFKRRWFSPNATTLAAQHITDLKSCIYRCCGIPETQSFLRRAHAESYSSEYNNSECNALTFVGFLAKHRDSGGRKKSDDNNNNNCLLFRCEARHSEELECGANRWLPNNSDRDDEAAEKMTPKMVARDGVLSLLILNRTAGMLSADEDNKPPKEVAISNSTTALNAEQSGEKEAEKDYDQQTTQNYTSILTTTTTSRMSTVPTGHAFLDDEDEDTLENSILKANSVEMDDKDDDGDAAEAEEPTSLPRNGLTAAIAKTSPTVVVLPTTKIVPLGSAEEAIKFDGTLHKNGYKHLTEEEDDLDDYVSNSTTIEVVTVAVSTKSKDGVGEILPPSSSLSDSTDQPLDLPYPGEKHSKNPQPGTGIPGLAGYSISGGGTSGQRSASQNPNKASMALSFNSSNSGRTSAPVAATTSAVPVWLLGTAIAGGIALGGLILAASMAYYCYWRRRRRHMQSTAFKSGTSAPALHAFNPPTAQSQQHPRRGSIVIISSAVSSVRHSDGVSGGREFVSPNGSARVAAGAAASVSPHNRYHHHHHQHNHKQ